jgi:Fur family ferric uptake transcriptional regulator
VRHHFEGGKAVYELNEGGHHDHLVCLQCGRVEEFYDSDIEKRQSKIAKDRGFSIHDHQLHIYADCIKVNCPHRPKG